MIQPLSDIDARLNFQRNLLSTPDSELGKTALLGKKALQQMCNGYSSHPELFIAPGGATRADMGDICQPYFESINAQGPSSAPPFTGGQCAKFYYVNIKTPADSPAAGGVRTDCGPYLGPIQGLRIQGNGSPVTEGRYNSVSVFVKHNGVESLEFTFNSSGGQPYPVSGWSIQSVSTNDGSYDGCGNLANETSPGTAPVFNFNTSYDVTINNQKYTTTINSPTVNNEDNSIFIPVIISGGVNFGLGSGGGASDSGTAPSDRPAVSAGLPIGGPIHEGLDEKFVEPPEGKEYVGCVVELFNVQTGSPPLPSSMPDKVWPFVVGNARLVYANSGIGDILGEARQVREDAFVMFRPTDRLKVVGAKMKLSYPGTYSITPLLADKPE